MPMPPRGDRIRTVRARNKEKSSSSPRSVIPLPPETSPRSVILAETTNTNTDAYDYVRIDVPQLKNGTTKPAPA